MCPSGLDSGPKRYRRSIGPKDNGPRGNFTTLRAHVCRDFGGTTRGFDAKFSAWAIP